MSRLRDAADSLKRHIKVLEDLQFAAGALEGLDSIENEQREAQDRLNVINQQADSAKGRVAHLLEQAQALDEANQAALVQTAQAAAKTLADAKTKIDELIAAASERAKNLLSDATDQADKIKAAAQAAAQDAVQAAADARQAVEKSNAELETAKQTLSDLTAKIEAGKAKVAAFLQ
jgi:chromosome segregation ATPase